MPESLQSVGAITLFVANPRQSKSFYQHVFGLEPVYEDANSAVFKFENLIVNLLDVREAPGLIAPHAVADQEAGSRFQLSIWVEDTDAVCAQLAEGGVTLLNGPVTRPWGMRTAAFTDPDGHIWEIAQEVGA